MTDAHPKERMPRGPHMNDERPTYDSICYSAARHFLGVAAPEGYVKALAQHIQDQAKDWLDGMRWQIQAWDEPSAVITTEDR